MNLEEPLYTILLNTEEVQYLCKALEQEARGIPSSLDISLWLFHANDEGDMQVIMNETGYGLVSHLRFGGMNRSKMWARVEE